MPPAKTNKGRGIVCYTGAGAKATGIHTGPEFLRATRRLCKDSREKCPEEGDVAGWVGWAGALIRTPSQCKAIVKNNRRIAAAGRAVDRAAEALEACTAKACDEKRIPGVKPYARCALLRCPEPCKKLIDANARLDKLAKPKKK